MTAVLEVSSLVRRFGRLVAVDDLSFAVERGEVCGFIGPNGAGKTTTMRICATLDLPDAGDARVEGASVLDRPRESRHRLGFMPDSYGAYANTTVAEYLDFFGRAYGLRRAERRARVGELTEFVGLGGLLDKRMDALSKGMRQRLCLAKTLVHDPSVLILDEPAAGLDPRARIEFRELVRSLAELEKAVLISSHILTELAEMCDSVVVIEQGRIRASGSVGEILRALRGKATHLVVRALAEESALERFLLEQPGVVSARPGREGVEVELDGADEEVARLVAALVEAGLRPVEVRTDQADLEDLFLSLTEGRVQ